MVSERQLQEDGRRREREGRREGGREGSREMEIEN